ncbi:beta strand repeat-containing protein, partial [Dapis sp. BLCC M126]|uniref:beta strand repeat-containing protein n=1 Tax=Dapis sp. BLCC M126 TaxID=3400189 RepID=UPI003CF37A7A
MKLLTLHLYPLMAFVSVLGTVGIPAHSQPIIPATDGTGTTVKQNGNQFNIQGGTQSSNGANLFHSFSQFNVESNQTANFLTTPDISNILGRVTGGNASTINGLIQVVGGNSNLFLMNPAGIIFGPNSRLNVPASFSVTTATGIGFNGNNFWFKAMGTNNYSNLVGNPSGYHFDVSNPGAVVNEGNLSLNPGNNLTLAGGTVVNTGELSTAGGNITIAAVNGGDTLRISQPGHVLSLDVSPASANLSGEPITPLSLAQLLTGDSTNHASSVIVDAQGNLVLTDDTTGLAIASGNIDVSSPSNPPYQGDISSLPLDKEDGRGIGGQINVLGDRVAVIDANIQANGLNGGGRILIGGDVQGNRIVPNSQQTFVNNNSFIFADAINSGNGGQVIIWSDDTTNFAGNISAKGGEFSGDGGFVEISGKQELIFDGNVNVSAALGEPGTILFDPKNITIGAETQNSNEDDNQTFSAAEIEGLEGEIILQADNDITVNQPIETYESIELNAGRSININADINTSSGNSNITLSGNDDGADINNRDSGTGSINQAEGTTLNAGSGDITILLGSLGENGDINLANLTTTGQLLVNANRGNIRRVSPNSLLTANRAIFETESIGGVGLAEAPLRIDVNNLEVFTGERGLFLESINNLIIGGVSEEVEGISTFDGGDVEISINGNLTVTERIITSTPDSQPGNITISSTGNIDTTQTTLDANSASTSGGDVFLRADGDIKTGEINVSTGGNNRGGNVTINSSGEVDTTANEIFSGSLEGSGGNVAITSNGDLKTGNIDSRSDGSSNGGDITLESTGGNIDTSSGELSSYSVGADAGNVSITSQGDIKTRDIFSSAGEPLDIDGDLENPTNTDSNENGSGSGGDITLRAEGTIDTSAGTIESFSRLGGGGIVSITTKGDITTGGVFSTAGEPTTGASVNTAGTTQTEINSSNSGNITIESTEGAVTTTEEIDTAAVSGNAGSVTIKAFGDIKTENIESSTFAGDGGDVTIESTNGSIDTTGVAGNAEIFSLSIQGNAGNVNVKSNENLITGNITSNSENGRGGNISLESTSGNIDSSSGELASSSSSGDAGNVSLTSQGNITTANISSFAGQGFGEAEDSENSASGNGGDITLRAEGTIDTTAGTNGESNLESFSRDGSGGNIILEAKGDITTDRILSSAGDPDSGNILAAITQTEGNVASSGDISIKSTEGSVTTTAEINSFATTGDGGSVTVESFSDLNIGNEINSRSDVDGAGGNIFLESQTGAITIEGRLSSFSELGNAGGVNIISSGNLMTADIDSRSNGSGQGGNISLESTGGSVDTSGGELSSFSELGNAGGVNITSSGNLTASGIDSRSNGSGQGGSISLESKSGNVDTTGGEIFSFSELGDAGGVNIISNGNLTTSSIDSRSKGSGQGGGIRLESKSGNVDTTGGFLSSFSELGNAGGVNITSTGNLTTADIDSRSNGSGQGGSIFLESTGGNVDTSIGELSSFSVAGNAGNVNITSNLDLITGGIDSRSEGNGRGGDITLEAEGKIDAGAIESFSRQGTGGNITLTSNDDINIGSSDEEAGINSEAKTSSDGGDITIESQTGDITINSELSSSSQTGNGGDITIEGKTGDITINSELSSSSQTGNGGDIKIFAGGDINTTNGALGSFSGEEIDENRDPQTLTGGNQGGQGGNITLEAGGKIDVGVIESFSREGSGGTIKLEAKGNITTTSEIISSAADPEDRTTVGQNSESDTITQSQVEEPTSRQSGNIDIESTEGTVTTQGEITSYSNKGAGGNITIIGDGDINISTGAIDSRTDGTTNSSNGGEISITSNTGNITIEGELSSSSQTGKGGPVNITAPGNITSGAISSFSEVNGDGGEINITSTQGNLTIDEISSSSGEPIAQRAQNSGQTNSNSGENTTGGGGDIILKADEGSITVGNIEAFSRQGEAGNININAKGDIITDAIISSAANPEEISAPGRNDENAARTQSQVEEQDNRPGGDISIISTEGTVTTNAEITSYSDKGDGGDISIVSQGNIRIITDTDSDTEAANIDSRSDGTGGSGGNIMLESQTGIIDAPGEFASSSQTGNGGNVEIFAPGNIQVENISSFSEGNGNGGDVNITGNSDIKTGTIESFTEGSGNSGNISIFADGAIDTSFGDLISRSQEGNGGDVTITGNNDIQTGTIESFTEGSGNGGNISITTADGSIDTSFGDLISRSQEGNGGDVNITGNSDIKTGTIESFTEGSGNSGNISIFADGAIDTSVGQLSSFSAEGEGGNVILSAKENITTGFIETFSGGGTRGGNITLETTNGNIDTTVGPLDVNELGVEANISTDADVSSADVATIFAEERANLSSSAPEGTGGNIVIIQQGEGEITTSNISSFGGEDSGAVNIINNNGNINTGVIFSTAINGTGGQISLETTNNGDLNINHIATYGDAETAIGGDISLDASGVVNINNIASFGQAGSGDVNIQSSSGSINTGTIETRAPNGTSGNITLNTFSTEGDIRTASVTTQGGAAAGQVEIIATDGSVTTEDLESSSESGSAGGINVEAGEDIETGDQTVESATGDATITNEAGGDITTGDQTAITGEGDATITNEAGGDITTGDQTAITGEGDATITNVAGGDITTGDQTAITGEGDATITNVAGGDITTGDQTAITGEGDATITNVAGGDITTGDQ